MTKVSDDAHGPMAKSGEYLRRNGLATFVSVRYIFEPSLEEERIMRNTFLVGGILIVACALGVAQQTTKKDGKPAKKVTAASEPAANSAMPKPSPEIQKLIKSFSGRFKVTGKILDETWAPGGDTGSGTEMVKKGPGGFTAISEAKMTFKKMGPMTGHGVLWWDDGKKAYQGMWCDSWGPTCQPSGDGKWDGDKLVFNGEMMMGPAPMKIRQTYSNFSAKGYDWNMEAGDDKGNWKPQMSLRYEREMGQPKN
jgi:hypothetical protein